MEGRTILHMACHEGYLDLVKFLLNEGADMSDADDEGDTPLHYASFGLVYKSHLDLVVQSIVSLMSSLVVKMLTVLVSTISYSQIFLLKKCE